MPVACRPADPASRPVRHDGEQQRSLQLSIIFDLGFVVGMPGGGVHDHTHHRVVSHLQNVSKYHYSEPGIGFSTIKLA